MFRISFVLNDVTGLMEVSFKALSQEIVLQRGYFFKVTNFDRKVVAGCTDVSAEILVELGFVFPVKSAEKIAGL